MEQKKAFIIKFKDLVDYETIEATKKAFIRDINNGIVVVDDRLDIQEVDVPKNIVLITENYEEY